MYLTKLQKNQAIRLRNDTCPYCNKVLDKTNSNKEHVIGKKFVPKHSFERSWNLILQACIDCNFEKSQYEDDVSAITLGARRWFAPERDSETNKLINEKISKCKSRKTNKLVIDSIETMSYQVEMPGVDLNMKFSAPPQLDKQRINTLAQYHVMAFFYLLTYDEELKRGTFLESDLLVLNHAISTDWGNELQLSFATEVINWDTRIVASAAEDNFRIAIRKHPTELTWSWAIEWNQFCRIIGFFGEKKPIENTVSKLAKLRFFLTNCEDGSRIRQREEIPMADNDDLLFIHKIIA
jgi:hypothetical protein